MYEGEELGVEKALRVTVASGLGKGGLVVTCRPACVREDMTAQPRDDQGLRNGLNGDPTGEELVKINIGSSSFI
jgi:hypothetical protein